MITFQFTHTAHHQFLALGEREKERIHKKLTFLKNVDHIDSFLKPLKNLKPATHRIRIGSYRLLVEKNNSQTMTILKVGQRKDVYE